MQFKKVLSQKKLEFTTGNMYWFRRSETVIICDSESIGYKHGKQIITAMYKCHLVCKYYGASIQQYREQFHKVGVDINQGLLLKLIEDDFDPINCRILTRNGILYTAVNEHTYMVKNSKLDIRYSAFYNDKRKMVNTTKPRKEYREKTITRIAKDRNFSRSKRGHYNGDYWSWEGQHMKRKARDKYYSDMLRLDIEEYYDITSNTKESHMATRFQTVDILNTNIGVKHEHRNIDLCSM